MKSFYQTLERFLGRKQEGKSTKDPKTRLARVEPLEDRALLSATPAPGAETALVAELVVDSDKDAAVNLESLDVAAPLATSSDGDYSLVGAENALTETKTVEYLDYDPKTGTLVKSQHEATVVKNSKDGRWESGWYFVQESITMDNAVISCDGDVHMILADGCRLTITGKKESAGICCTGKNSLTIYGQSEGTEAGCLDVTGGDYSAGIGGNNEQTGQNITINGGQINATGGAGAAGIGGGWKGSGENIRINGGIVKATGTLYWTSIGPDDGSAGIGGGYMGSGSDITITGGTVEATGSIRGAGIGGGEKRSGTGITISGGTVVAKGGESAAGIGGGGSVHFRDKAGDGTGIKITGGTVKAFGGKYAAGIGGGYGGTWAPDGKGNGIEITGGKVEAVGGDINSEEWAVGIGSGGADKKYKGDNIKIYTASLVKGKTRNGDWKNIDNSGGDLANTIFNNHYKYVIVEPTKPATPTDVKTSDPTDSSITVSWTKVPNADSYKLEYKTTAATDWTVVNSKETRVKVEGLTRNTEYQFRVYAIRSNIPSEPSKLTTASTKQTQLTSVSIDGTAEVGQTLTATGISPDGATAEYSWYRSNETNAIGTGESYMVTVADVGHTITVKAIGKDGFTGEVQSAATAIVPKAVLATPSNFRTTAQTDSTITVAWDEVPNATGYELKYRKNGTLNWTTVKVSAKTYTVVGLNRVTNYQLCVKAVGSGSYDDSAFSNPPLNVTTKKTPLTSVSIAGKTEVGQTLTATSLKPTGATANYAWYRSNGATWTAIKGAKGSSYKVTTADVNYSLKVVATGTGNYEGTVESAPTSKISAVIPDRPTGFTVKSQTDSSITVSWNLVKNALGYKLSYKETNGKVWKVVSLNQKQTSYNAGGLTRNTEYEFQVVALGKGTVSEYASLNAKTNKTTLKKVSIYGTAEVGKTLTATGLDPKDATANYVWYRDGSAKAGEGKTYTVTLADAKHTITVKATGTGDYEGTVESKTKIAAVKLAAPTNFSAKATDASITLSWTAVPNAKEYAIEYCLGSQTSWKTKTTRVTTKDTTLVVTDLTRNTQYKFRIKADGYDVYDSSDYAELKATTAKTQLKVVAIKGTAQVGKTLTAAALEPTGATASYLWYRSGEEKPISSKSTYKVTIADAGRTLTVKATGTGSYSGTVESSTTVPLVKLATPKGFKANVATDATISVSWSEVKNASGYKIECKKAGEDWIEAGSTSDVKFTVSGLTRNSEYQIRVCAVGNESYSQSDYAELKKTTEKTELKNVEISGTPEVGETLTATVCPEGATATYRWYRSGEDEPIGDKESYEVTLMDVGRTLTVEATGADDYEGTVFATVRVRLIKLDTPEDFQVINKTDSTIAVQWSPVENASGYTVSYKETGRDVWKEFATTNGAQQETWALVDGLLPDTEYQFRVQATAFPGGIYANSNFATLVERTDAKTATPTNGNKDVFAEIFAQLNEELLEGWV